jgi:hypothetical protein
MKSNQILLFLGGILLQTTNLFGQTNCPNGNAENNNLGGWITMAGTATAPTQFLTNFITSNDINRFGVVGSTTTFGVPGITTQMISNGVDNYGGFSLPLEGNYCFRLGNNKTNNEADLMHYTFTVDNNNKKFKFNYAVVLEDGSHSSGQNPSFYYYVKLGSGILPFQGDNLFSATQNNIIADISNSFFKVSKLNSNVVYKNWQCVELNLESYFGQEVTFVAMTRDCSQGAHFGYAYIDGLCQNWPAIPDFSLNGNVFCPNHTIIMNASATIGEDRYTLEVLECNSLGVPTAGGSLFRQTFLNPVPNNIDISNFYTINGGRKFECGKYYRVTLSVKNDCSPLNEFSKVIEIKCLNIDSPNRDVCCGTTSTIGPKPLPLGGRTYNWSSIPQGFSASTSQVTVNPTSMTVYVLNVIDYNNPIPSSQGCFATDTIIVNPSVNNIMSVDKKNLVCTSSPTYTANFNVFSVGGGCTAPNQQILNLYSNYFNQSQNNKYNNIKWFFKYTSDPNGCNGNNGVTTDWSFIGNGRVMTAPNGTGQIKAEYFDPCYPTLTQTYTNSVFYSPNSDESLIAPNAMIPNSSIAENRIVRIQEFGDCAPNLMQAPAYGNIEDFELRIFDRWGVNFRTIRKSNVGRITDEAVFQGDIYWDGFNKNAGESNREIFQDGVYALKLYMKFCGQSFYRDVTSEITNSAISPCMKWSFFGNCQSYYNGNAGYVKAITVIR